MPDRTFTVNFAVAGLEPGVTVAEDALTGCNVDALVQGGFLTETGAPLAPTIDLTPQAEPDTDPTAGAPPLTTDPPSGG